MAQTPLKTKSEQRASLIPLKVMEARLEMLSLLNSKKIKVFSTVAEKTRQDASATTPPKL